MYIFETYNKCILHRLKLTNKKKSNVNLHHNILMVIKIFFVLEVCIKYCIEI